MTRPVQLGLLDGTDKAVGPMLTSVVHGNNSDLIAAVAPLYLTGSVLDVTYGRGMWWRRFTPPPVHRARSRAGRRRLPGPAAPRPVVRHRLLRPAVRAEVRGE